MSTLENNFKHHPPKNDATVEAHEAVRAIHKELSEVIVLLVPAGREQSLALTKIEESMFWANAGIARN